MSTIREQQSFQGGRDCDVPEREMDFESVKLNKEERFYLVHEDILPEAVLKTVQVKELLAQGVVKTVNEAVEKVGLSRSAFYKYKEGIYPLSQLERERIVTVSMDLQHRSGILSRVLALVAGYEGNVLTINQTIPLQGMANVVISVDTSTMGDQMPALMEALRGLDGVKRAAVIGQG
jgi:chorismate mutase